MSGEILSKQDVPVEAKSRQSNKLVEILRRNTEQAFAKHDAEPAPTPRMLLVPGLTVPGGLPNHINRSSLFAPISGKERPFYVRHQMVTRRDCSFVYTGQQLDEGDADLMMMLVFLAKTRPLGTPVVLNRAEFLRGIGRHVGKSEYQWLDQRLAAMCEAFLRVEMKGANGDLVCSVGSSKNFHLISWVDYDASRKTYTYQLDPRWVDLFGRRGQYSIIDWKKRLTIRRGAGAPLAKALQRLVATSTDPVQRYELHWLKEKMVYTGRSSDFKSSLSKSLAELKRVDVIRDARFEVNKRGDAQLMLQVRDQPTKDHRDSFVLPSG